MYNQNKRVNALSLNFPGPSFFLLSTEICILFPFLFVYCITEVIDVVTRHWTDLPIIRALCIFQNQINLVVNRILKHIQ